MPVEILATWRALAALGFVLLVGAYLTNQAGRCAPDARSYLFANVLGAGLLAAYSWVIGEWVFVALEGFWCVASVVAFARREPERA